jgi:phosphonate transport system permease protein
LENLRRFSGEVYPFALHDKPFSAHGMVTWGWGIWQDRAGTAALTTFAISIVAILIAGMLSIPAAFPAAHKIVNTQPLTNQANSRRSRFWVQLPLILSRCGFMLCRVIPEYILAFLLVSLLGPSAWPAILALAIHNFGILGRLGAETIENTPVEIPRALYAQGLRRSQVTFTAILPMSATRWCIFFFYRWETCIREATVLGMLGIASIGYWVRETRARDWYDEMLFFTLVGAGLVLIVDLISTATRRAIRQH